MSIKDYLKSKIGTIALNIIALIVLSLFLLSIGNELKAILIIVLCWIVTLFIYLFISYKKRNDYFQLLEKSIYNIDKKGNIIEKIDLGIYKKYSANGISYDTKNDTIWALMYSKYLLHYDKKGNLLKEKNYVK